MSKLYPLSQKPSIPRAALCAKPASAIVINYQLNGQLSPIIRQLHENFHTVDVVGTKREAIENILANVDDPVKRYDLAIADLVLPECSAIDLVREAYMQYDLPFIDFIVVGSREDPVEILRSARVGAFAYCELPVTDSNANRLMALFKHRRPGLRFQDGVKALAGA